jgi:hypothetical protein
MVQLILNDEQAQVLATALQPIQVCDAKGNVLRIIPPIWTEADIVEAKKTLATEKTWYTTEQVLAHLRALEQQ